MARTPREQFQGMTGRQCAELEIESAAIVARAEREIESFDMLIACATGAGSARTVLIRERAEWRKERDRAAAVLAALAEVL